MWSLAFAASQAQAGGRGVMASHNMIDWIVSQVAGSITSPAVACMFPTILV